jgi:hypothetical protein
MLQVVREGSNVTLKCAARGSPQPNITWRRESGEPIAITGQRDGKLMIFHCTLCERSAGAWIIMTLARSAYG